MLVDSGRPYFKVYGDILKENHCSIEAVFSSPELKAPGGAYKMGRLRCPSSVVRPSTISNDFSSETTGPIATKFYIQSSGPLGKKSCSNDLGHMTNMAAMPIYGKNLKKIFLQNQ